MKRLILLSVFAALPLFSLLAREYQVFGPEGGIAIKMTLPDGFDTGSEKCPMVLLMHGIFSSKDINPMPTLAKELAARGIASVRFDFDGHGKSEGRMQDMTIEKELADAKAVSSVGLLGHSQGGVVASMTAGRLASAGTAPEAVVLIAPGSVIKDACQGGKFFNATFDPKDPPEFIRCWGFMKLGREYLLTTQELDIYGTAADFKGPVLLLHGTKDGIVPMWCSEKYLETYGDHAVLKRIEGENHLISKKKQIVVDEAVSFFEKNL